MCRSLNKNAPTWGHDKLQRIITQESFGAQLKVKHIMKNKAFSSATDAWTSSANDGYVATTVYFIDQHSWNLHGFVLGLFTKDGASTHDVMDYAEHQMNKLTWHTVTLFMSFKTLRQLWLFLEEYLLNTVLLMGGNIVVLMYWPLAWAGNRYCIQGHSRITRALTALWSLVHYFSSSPQALQKLLVKQRKGFAVTCIQDVSTWWWSIFTMCNQLLQLKDNFGIF